MNTVATASNPAATVYASDAGRRFHDDPNCRLLRLGQDLSDWDCWGDYCTHQHPHARAIRPYDLTAAAATRRTACRVCVPPALALPYTGETYGHEPVQLMRTGWGYEPPVCVRCGWNDGRVPVWWPCMSAVVLGLVERGGA